MFYFICFNWILNALHVCFEDDEEGLPVETLQLRRAIHNLQRLSTRIKHSAPHRFLWNELQTTILTAEKYSEINSAPIPPDLLEGDGEDYEEDGEGEIDAAPSEGALQGILRTPVGERELNHHHHQLSASASVASNPTQESPAPKIRPLILPTVVPTRWNSTFFFLQRALDLQKVIEELLKNTSFEDLLITDGQWSLLGVLVSFLKKGKETMLRYVWVVVLLTSASFLYYTFC